MTFVRLPALLRISSVYFANQKGEAETLYKYWIRELGDDRWLTQLLLLHASIRNALQLDTSVICETRPTKNFQALLSQRRRWLLGRIATDAHANLSLDIWKKSPIMQHYRLLYRTIRIPDAHAILLGIAIILWNDENLQYLGVTIWVIFGINWVFILCFGVWRRRISALLYPVFLVTIPFLNFICRYYTLATVKRRTWGGPRASVDLK